MPKQNKSGRSNRNGKIKIVSPIDAPAGKRTSVTISDIQIDSDNEGDMITICGPLAAEIRATGVDPRQFVMEAVTGHLVVELEKRREYLEKLSAIVR